MQPLVSKQKFKSIKGIQGLKNLITTFGLVLCVACTAETTTNEPISSSDPKLRSVTTDNAAPSEGSNWENFVSIKWRKSTNVTVSLEQSVEMCRLLSKSGNFAPVIESYGFPNVWENRFPTKNAAWKIEPNNDGITGFRVVYFSNGELRNASWERPNTFIAAISYWMDRDEECVPGTLFSDRDRTGKRPNY